MADSRRFPQAETPAGRDVRLAVAVQLAQALPHGGRVAVALSGGRDSVALFDAAIGVAASVRCEVVAFHVDHGLSSNAGAWSRFCRDLCASHAIRFATRAVDVPRAPRTSLEAQARAARYSALRALADEHDVSAVLLAHHADDQAETVLLQLLRGAGVRGLSAMPAARREGGLLWLRPLLQISREVLDGYVAGQRLRFVDDESNADRRHRRNGLRASIVPALRALAPGYPQALVRSAAHQAEAAALLDDLAELDARSVWDGGSLDRGALRSLDGPRARNLFRWFLRKHGLRVPSSARLGEILRQFLSAADDAGVAVEHCGVELGLHRGRIAVHRAASEPYAQEWTGTTTVELPHGTLVFAKSASAGIAVRHLAGSHVTIRAGGPGERLQLAGRASHRRVADLLREAGIPAWERAGLPRIYCGDSLAAVACAGINAEFASAVGEPAFALGWTPRPATRWSQAFAGDGGRSRRWHPSPRGS